nr:undecaprenyl-diphosphate phosphatase [Acidobacteriota bacterium]
MGLVQGVTELFPVSSLGHSVLLPGVLGWHNLVSSQARSESFFLVFLVGLHVGTACGLIVYYRATWFKLLRGLLRQVRASRQEGASSLWQLSSARMDHDYRVLFLLVLGSIPVGLAGFLLDKPLRELFAKPLAAAIFLTLNGVILLVGERMRQHRGRHAHYETIATLSGRNAVVIGSAQILGLLAGISRSGATMVAGITRGLDHEDAANFSFLLATPVILLAGLYKLPSLMGHLGQGVRAQTAVGAVCAGVAAYVAVRFLTRWFTTKTLNPFGVYCLVVGI